MPISSRRPFLANPDFPERLARGLPLAAFDGATLSVAMRGATATIRPGARHRPWRRSWPHESRGGVRSVLLQLARQLTRLAPHRLLREVAPVVDAGGLKTTLGEHCGIIEAANPRRAHAHIESAARKARLF